MADQQTVPDSQRWPKWVYESGSEPDARFSFANERTLLAWLRTSLALLAAGVALDAVDLSFPPGLQRGLAALLVVMGLVTAAASWLRWARAERALRRSEPLPASGVGALLALAVIVAGLLVLATGV